MCAFLDRGHPNIFIIVPFRTAAAIKLVEEPTAAAVDIRADYVAKNGAPSAAAPKIFFRYYLVDSSTGVKSQVMLAETKWVAGA